MRKSSFSTCAGGDLSLPRELRASLSISLRPMNAQEGSEPRQQASLPISRLSGPIRTLNQSSLTLSGGDALGT
jgi:hypothetical protein